MKNRIKLIRKHFGLTQQEFASRLCIKQNTISQYESGRNLPVDSVISLICREFNVNETWLRTGEGEMLALPDAAAELANFCADVLTGVSGPSVQRLVSLLAGCSAEEIAVLDRLLDRVAAEWQKEKDTD